MKGLSKGTVEYVRAVMAAGGFHKRGALGKVLAPLQLSADPPSDEALAAALAAAEERRLANPSKPPKAGGGNNPHAHFRAGRNHHKANHPRLFTGSGAA